MSAQSSLNAREKGDIYREKRDRYTASAEVRGLSQENMFHLDTAHFVLEEYGKAEPKPLMTVTGGEFDDRPPTASGQRAFALSVAEMKKTLDALNGNEISKDLTLFREPERVKELMGQTIRDFFRACGVDEQGEKLKDHRSIKEDRVSFFQSRDAFSGLIRSETAFRKRKLIEEFRKERGLEEFPEAEVTEDPLVDDLCAKYPEAAEKYSDKIRQIKEVKLKAKKESAGIRAGRDALYAEGKQVFLDESKDWEYRRFLRDAYLFWSLEADERLRELAYTRQAADCLLKWLLCEESVEEVIFEHIVRCFDLAPKLLEREMLLKDLKGYVHPDEEIDFPLPEDMEQMTERAKEVSRYLEEHPDQFDAQCLYSIISDIDGLCRCSAKAWSVVQWIDSFTLTDAFRALDKEGKIRLFKICVEMDVVCHAGHTMIDFLRGLEDRTVGEASDRFKNVFPWISYSILEKQSKEALGMIFMERSGFHVSEQKDRFLEYFGV